MKIRPDATTSINGFSFACEISHRVEDIIKVFPQAASEGYYDPEKGYSGEFQARFAAEGAIGFYVYERWKNPRIGCLHGNRNPNLQAFIQFLNNALCDE